MRHHVRHSLGSKLENGAINQSINQSRWKSHLTRQCLTDLSMERRINYARFHFFSVWIRWNQAWHWEWAVLSERTFTSKLARGHFGPQRDLISAEFGFYGPTVVRLDHVWWRIKLEIPFNEEDQNEPRGISYHLFESHAFAVYQLLSLSLLVYPRFRVSFELVTKF